MNYKLDFILFVYTVYSDTLKDCCIDLEKKNTQDHCSLLSTRMLRLL